MIGRRTHLKVRSLYLIFVLLIMGAFALTPFGMSSAAAEEKNPLENVKVKGSSPDGAKFKGEADIEQFLVENNTLYAVGTLTGELRKADKTTTPVAVSDVKWPVEAINGKPLALSGTPATLQATCEILRLELGELNLNLLGLEVFLDEVTLVITANPAGGLLGQLLCAVANLLDGLNLGALLQIANLLNQILDILNDL
jgi:hypothetical protein